MDVRSIPFEKEFDVVGLFDVLEHVVEDQVALENVYRAIKPGGGLLLTVPQHPWLWSAADDYAFHKRRYTRTDLKRKLESAGFSILRITSFMSLLLPLMASVRLMKRDSSEFNPLRELTIGATQNRCLKAVLFAESLFIRPGLSLPHGGSLMVVASKLPADRVKN